MSEEILDVGTAFKSAHQGETFDSGSSKPFLTFYFDPESFGIDRKSEYGFLRELFFAYSTAVMPRTGSLPGITGNPEVLGYGKAEDGLYYLKFTYENLAEQIDELLQYDRVLCHWAAAQVVKAESSTGTRVHLRDVRFRTENINPNETAPALI
jgi:hypothetical protein